MDIQLFGANCVVLSNKNVRIVVDDNLAALGGKPVAKEGDVVLFTGAHDAVKANPKIMIDQPGEYEVADVSIYGIPAQAHLDADGKRATIYKLIAGETTVVVLGHIYPELSDAQLESIGMVDVLLVPVGGNGYTLDPVGALKLIKKIEPKVVIPTHYDDGLTYEVPQQPLSEALKVLALEPKETTSKYKPKALELTDTTQLVVLERP